MDHQDDTLSMISQAHQVNNLDELSSDSSNCCVSDPHASKKPRIERFKGVVEQSNGQWGAQIYAKQGRVWLGTFKTETEAAMAYDSAAMKLLSGDCYRNFQFSSVNIEEAKFQRHYTEEAILSMIRDHTYPREFSKYLNGQEIEREACVNSHENGDEFSCSLLFNKELTPSDVGKLNRLVIPKRYAVKYFSNIPDPSEYRLSLQKADDGEVKLYDRNKKLWKFRYCYWKSSQSYVFTRGWNRFVKEKGLDAGDTIAFYKYESRHFSTPSFLMIGVAKRGRLEQAHKAVKGLKFGNYHEPEKKQEGFGDSVEITEKISSTTNKSTRGIRLFGVQIEEATTLHL